MTDLHAVCMAAAKAAVKHHIEKDDGEKRFNLFTFLEGLEGRLYGVLDATSTPTGRFQVDAAGLARYLWCCLSLESGDKPDGTTFRGMPILD